MSNKGKILNLQEAAIERNQRNVPPMVKPFMDDNIKLRQENADLRAALQMTTDTLDEYKRADASLIEQTEAESAKRDDERDELLLHIAQLEGDIERLEHRA